jgi:hypothetical protein
MKEPIMILPLSIPDALTGPLRAVFGADLARAAVEQLALDGYRTGKISRYQVQQLLGFDNRYDTENWLGERGATPHYAVTDLEADLATLDRIQSR